MSDFTRGFLPPARVLGGHLNGLIRQMSDLLLDWEFLGCKCKKKYIVFSLGKTTFSSKHWRKCVITKRFFGLHRSELIINCFKNFHHLADPIHLKKFQNRTF